MKIPTSCVNRTDGVTNHFAQIKYHLTDRAHSPIGPANLAGEISQRAGAEGATAPETFRQMDREPVQHLERACRTAQQATEGESPVPDEPVSNPQVVNLKMDQGQISQVP